MESGGYIRVKYYLGNLWPLPCKIHVKGYIFNIWLCQKNNFEVSENNGPKTNFSNLYLSYYNVVELEHTQTMYLVTYTLYQRIPLIP